MDDHICNLNDIYDRLGELNGMMSEFTENTKKVLDKHDKLIDSLKTSRDQQIGKQTIVNIVVAAIFGLIGSFISGGWWPHK